jgi:hypothetical protein
VSPRLRSLLARVTLVAGVAAVAGLVATNAPHEQAIVVRLGSIKVSRIEGVVTKQGDSEPTAGFSRDFSGVSPRTVRHTFSAPNGTYTVVITLRPTTSPDSGDGQSGAKPPIPSETSLERRVTLAGGEVIVSPE